MSKPPMPARAGSCGIIDGGLRQPAGDGIAMAKRHCKVGGPQSEKFLRTSRLYPCFAAKLRAAETPSM